MHFLNIFLTARPICISNTRNDFLYINKEETKPCLNTQLSTVVFNRTIYAILVFSPKCKGKVNKNLYYLQNPGSLFKIACNKVFLRMEILFVEEYNYAMIIML